MSAAEEKKSTPVYRCTRIPLQTECRELLLEQLNRIAGLVNLVGEYLRCLDCAYAATLLLRHPFPPENIVESEWIKVGNYVQVYRAQRDEQIADNVHIAFALFHSDILPRQYYTPKTCVLPWKEFILAAAHCVSIINLIYHPHQELHLLSHYLPEATREKYAAPAEKKDWSGVPYSVAETEERDYGIYKELFGANYRFLSMLICDELHRCTIDVDGLNDDFCDLQLYHSRNLRNDV